MEGYFKRASYFFFLFTFRFINYWSYTTLPSDVLNNLRREQNDFFVRWIVTRLMKIASFRDNSAWRSLRSMYGRILKIVQTSIEPPFLLLSSFFLFFHTFFFYYYYYFTHHTYWTKSVNEFRLLRVYIYVLPFYDD